MRKVWPFVGIALAVGVGVRIAPYIEYWLVGAVIVYIAVPAWAWVRVGLERKAEDAEYIIDP